MTQRIETLNDIIEVLETDADVRRRVFEALGLPAYIGDAVITPLTERIDAPETAHRSEMSEVRSCDD